MFPEVDATPDVARIQTCYLDKHPDARSWLPGDERGAHTVSPLVSVPSGLSITGPL